MAGGVTRNKNQGSNHLHRNCLCRFLKSDVSGNCSSIMSFFAFLSSAFSVDIFNFSVIPCHSSALARTLHHILIPLPHNCKAVLQPSSAGNLPVFFC